MSTANWTALSSILCRYFSLYSQILFYAFWCFTCLFLSFDLYCRKCLHGKISLSKVRYIIAVTADMFYCLNSTTYILYHLTNAERDYISYWNQCLWLYKCRYEILIYNGILLIQNNIVTLGSYNNIKFQRIKLPQK